MSQQSPTLQDIWRVLGAMNKRFDSFEKQMVRLEEKVTSEISVLRSQMTAGFGALRASIEARDFRLDEHSRRISELETRMDERPPT